MDTTVRTYTGQELNALLDQMRAVVNPHHPAIAQLLSMALLLEALCTLCREDARHTETMPWIRELIPFLVHELLRGQAELFEHGVELKTPTVN